MPFLKPPLIAQAEKELSEHWTPAMQFFIKYPVKPLWNVLVRQLLDNEKWVIKLQAQNLSGLEIDAIRGISRSARGEVSSDEVAMAAKFFFRTKLAGMGKFAKMTALESVEQIVPPNPNY
ncbi:MAG: hypothetical protein CM15mP103_10480 [Gammaproteobacteria bacterium]|nr:MAG: hypothetical protein CM15mP103_10480 [Gammaproteobacteria bacterium]